MGSLNEDEALKFMADCPLDWYLVGSRYVGISNHRSDHDFIVPCTYNEYQTVLKPWLVSNGFRLPNNRGYGPDDRLHGFDSHLHPQRRIDVLAMNPDEALRRMAVFDALRKRDPNDAGLFCKGMKETKSWPMLWNIVASFEED